jgi:crossover junction endodeoxyribonuclease RuvC
MSIPVLNSRSQPVSDRILGIDPGLQRTGYSLIERTTRGPVLREGGVVRSEKAASLARRVHEIAAGVCEVLDEFRPQAVAIEQVFSLGRNPKTALLMAHARGAILAAVAQREIPIVHFTPRQIKRLLTGSGKASKDQVQRAIQREFDLDGLLEPNDVADASAVALCLYYNVRFAA